MSSNKIIGYILITIGLAVIIFSIYQSYQIFTNKAPAPQMFFGSSKTINKAGDLEETIKNQLENILPANNVSQLLNLASWSILAGILIFGGGQIAGLGIKLATSKHGE